MDQQKRIKLKTGQYLNTNNLLIIKENHKMFKNI